ncbi:MAG TPA: NADH-ubiquinone oxidoreductase-F iron-sulfur binding region domain-containing protein [Methylomirabilota bacterium]|nr:NADH-ubiquinone oxidoreductase-F iron-sulfur binding region domain-containing protein [Methylomirabilota bacterium]
MGVLFPNGSSQKKETLEAYLTRGGYQALEKAYTELGPQGVLEMVEAAELLGRGGAAFPTAKKWRFARQEPSPRYVVLNGGEDEPGSLKDRMLMEHHPHLVLEGVLLAAHAIEAEEAYLYVNHTYEAAIGGLKNALAEARSKRYVKIPFTLFPAPTEYVAGEDTAALEAIEGKEALPRKKPPYPTTAGLFGKPTVVNNVETFANVPPIVLKGPQWYRSIGSEGCHGTALFTLGEEMSRPGVYELPFGTPLRYLIEQCGGGLRSGTRLKAILPGGPSSAFLTPDQLDVKLDYGSLVNAGSTLGCGVVRCLAEDECVVEELLRIARFFEKESCGQCSACRMETGMLKAILEKSERGEGTTDLLPQVEKVINFAKGKGFCSLIGMPGPPITSALRLFPEDFQAHLREKRCPYKREG